MSTEESKQIGYPLEPASLERIEVFSIEDDADLDGQPYYNKQEGIDWHLMYTKTDQMIDSSALDRVQSYLGLQSVPEMLFGDSRFYLTCPQRNFILSFSPLDCLRLCAFSEQQRRLTSATQNDDTPQQEAASESQAQQTSDEQLRLKDLNSIDIIPTPIQAHQAAKWEQKDLSGVQFGVVGAIEKTMDWSFQSAYKGTIGQLCAVLPTIPAEIALPEAFAQKLQSGLPTDIAFAAAIRRDEASVQDMPLEMLGQDNPIKLYGQVVLYEDEFADRGYSKSYVRFRVMKDCLFILQRSYVRIDHVTVRILDTRIFHEFSRDHLIRDFCHKESTYGELRQAGFAFGSDWLLSETQSDQVYSYLKDVATFKDIIMLSASEE